MVLQGTAYKTENEAEVFADHHNNFITEVDREEKKQNRKLLKPYGLK